jgi:VIT1/CCC1 family predicted Fe2+/Mn2+ transporter
MYTIGILYHILLRMSSYFLGFFLGFFLGGLPTLLPYVPLPYGISTSPNLIIYKLF